jgi:hypothetical protein
MHWQQVGRKAGFCVLVLWGFVVHVLAPAAELAANPLPGAVAVTSLAEALAAGGWVLKPDGCGLYCCCLLLCMCWHPQASLQPTLCQEQ